MLPKTLVGIVGAVFLFGFAVFVHELGHFTVAKMLGVGVKKFAIGFGPKIWAVVWHGTEYSLRWIPVGGFVALKGMIEGLDDEPKEESSKESATREPARAEPAKPAPAKKEGGAGITEDLDALRDRHPLARIAVFAAGVTCNFLTAVFLIGFMAWRGVPVEKPWPNRLYEVPEGSRLYELGWRGGDRIVQAAGRPVRTWDDVASATQSVFKEKELATTVTFLVVRDERTISLLLPQGISDKDCADFEPPLPAIVGAAIPQSGAATARLVKDDYEPGETIGSFPTWEEMPQTPLREGDRIVAIEDTPVTVWQEMNAEIRKRPNQAVLLTVERTSDGRKHRMRLLTVLESTDEKPPQGRLGIIMGIEFTGEREREPFVTAFALAPIRTVRKARAYVVLTVDFFREMGWKETKRNLGGPLKIGQIAYQSARKGLDHYLSLFAVISLMLAIFNLLPIPVLDGGYILITLIETAIRRPIPERVLIPILTTFMLFFIMFMGWVSINDIINW
ncbi:site-2 protease family protein [Candidatus Sumerlaeota bacterium]|nr:site-2 protease family protein [Candidatus Sumerlaeota bacterium]